MTIIMNAMIEEWFAELLATNNTVDADNLTETIILDEIEEIKGSIKNEKIWALGAPTKSSAAMHLGNIENLEEYIEFLETLLP